MPNSNLTRAEKIAFNADLNRHMDNETLFEQRKERVEAYASDLMMEGEEFYPFTPSAVNEALSEMSTGQLAVLAACLAEADSQKTKNDHANHMALTAVLMPIKEYWLKAAKHHAEEYLE